MLSDVEIAQATQPRPIAEIAAKLGIGEDALYPYGRDKAKIDLSVLDGPRKRERPGKVILVSAITPTRAGEGKTTTTIGLGQVRRNGYREAPLVTSGDALPEIRRFLRNGATSYRAQDVLDFLLETTTKDANVDSGINTV